MTDIIDSANSIIAIIYLILALSLYVLNINETSTYPFACLSFIAHASDLIILHNLYITDDPIMAKDPYEQFMALVPVVFKSRYKLDIW